MVNLLKIFVKCCIIVLLISGVFNVALASGLYTTTYSYGSGNKVTVKDPRGYTTKYIYQSFGNPDKKVLTQIQQPNGTITTITRNVFNKIISVKQGNLTRTYQYDAHQHLIKEHNPEANNTIYGRDLLGEMISKSTNGSGITTYVYDSMGRLIHIGYPNAKTPNVDKVYDAVGRIVRINAGHTIWHYHYDPNGNLTAVQLQVSKKTFNLIYDHNNSDQVCTITYPDGTIVNLNPDAWGRPTQAQPFVTKINYFANGDIQSFTDANSIVTTYTLNDRQRVDQIKAASEAGHILFDLQYLYDPNGNIQSITDKYLPVHNRQFSYNQVNWLTGAFGPWGSGKISYNLNGDITSKSIGKQQLTYKYNSNDLLTHIVGSQSETFTYDVYSNITADTLTSFTYNDASQLIHAGWKKQGQPHSVDYVYDGNGNRALVNQDNAKTYEVYHKNQLFYTLNDKTGAVTDYIYLAGHKIAKVTHSTQNAAASNDANFYHDDVLGSPIMATDALGNEIWSQGYQPYGSELNTIGKRNNLHVSYTGKQYNSDIGLAYYGARYYNPLIGRFMSTDPKGFTDKNLMSFNRYAYANDNPYVYIDPTGEFSFNNTMHAISRTIQHAINNSRSGSNHDFALLMSNNSKDQYKGMNALLVTMVGDGAGDIAKVAEEGAVDLAKSVAENADIEEIAKRIANGHAFGKHVIEKAEFPGIKTIEDFTRHIENVMNNADEIRSLNNGRTAYWHEESGTAVIHDPSRIDQGTAFAPVRGKAYFNGLT